MNRRDFLKFFGKATAVTGAALATGLPEVEVKEDIDLTIDETDQQLRKITRWCGESWSNVWPNNGQVLEFDIDGTFCAGGEFTELGKFTEL